MSDYSVWESAVEFLDTRLPNSFPISLKLFDKISKELQEENMDLKNQLLIMKHHNQENVGRKSTKMVELTDDASHAIEEIDKVSHNIGNHISVNESRYKLLKKLLNDITNVNKCSRYFASIAELEELSSFIQSAMLVGSMDQAVDHFRKLISLAELSKNTNCIYLYNYIQSTALYWYKMLLDSFAGEMEQTLQAFGWPFIVTSVKHTLPVNAELVKNNVGTLINQLMKIQLPNFLSANVDTTFKCKTKHNICLPMQFFLVPFKTRFQYHFEGDRKTNDIEKPEWYFTQANLYLAEHKSFLTDKLQKIFNEAGYPQVHTLSEFVEGLILLVSDKLRTDLMKLLGGNHPNSNQLFAHHVDEALSFHVEVSSDISNPESFSGCLNVLIERDIFKKWLTIEKEYALRKMDDMFSMKDAWLVHTTIMMNDDNDYEDINNKKLPQFAELFFILLATIQERYALLPSAKCQLKFAQLQLYLIDDFRIRLFQIRKQVTSELSQLAQNTKYFAILNTVAFVADFLKKWSDDPFYIKLSYHKRNLEEIDERKHFTKDDSKFDEDYRELKEVVDFDLCNQDSNLDSLLNEPSIFDNIIELYERMKTEMMEMVSNFIFRDFEEYCKPYIKGKWLALPSHREFLTLTLSNSACPMLRCLKTHLEEMEGLLSRSLFTSLWQRLTQLVDDHIFENVICCNRFNEGGAMQINFDMTRNLFPLFLRYSNKPENFFKNIKEACVILTLAPGSALLIQDVLKRALHLSETNVEVSDPVSALHDVGVYKLHLEQVELLLSLRMDLHAL